MSQLVKQTEVFANQKNIKHDFDGKSYRFMKGSDWKSGSDTFAAYADAEAAFNFEPIDPISSHSINNDAILNGAELLDFGQSIINGGCQ